METTVLKLSEEIFDQVENFSISTKLKIPESERKF